MDFALCGGLAMAVYAFPRATLDMDILIQESNLEKVKQIAKNHGYSFDSGLMEFQEGTIKI